MVIYWTVLDLFRVMTFFGRIRTIWSDPAKRFRSGSATLVIKKGMSTVVAGSNIQLWDKVLKTVLSVDNPKFNFINTVIYFFLPGSVAPGRDRTCQQVRQTCQVCTVTKKSHDGRYIPVVKEFLSSIQKFTVCCAKYSAILSLLLLFLVLLHNLH